MKHFYKIIYSSFLVLGLFSQTKGQTKEENYIRTIECLDSSCSKKKENIVYYDGLGREKQVLQVAASPTGKTIVTPFEYDGFGRQSKEFLPFPISSSDNKISSVTDGSSFYSTLTGDTTPYSEKTFENSPLNRVLSQAAPGESWKKGADHEIGFSYETNTNGEVLRFDVSLDTNYVPTLVENGNYSAGTLYKTVTTDENKQAIQEFKDKEGRVILKRIDIPQKGEQNSSGKHDTYYVYDVYGNLTFVLPPKLIEVKDYKSNLAELGYQYQYDKKNRLVEKQLPGKGREYMVYDNQDRLVGTQYALMEAENKWLFTKYDKFGRIAITGIEGTSIKRTDLQSYINTLGDNNVSRDSNGYKHDNITIYYTTNGYGASNHVLTVNYYDDYPATASKSTEKNIASGKSLNGLPTHSIVREIDTWNFMYSTTFYDDKYLRPVQTYSTNVLGGYTQINSTLDFRGKVLTTVTKHKRTSSDEEITVKETFDYYENELLKTHTHQVNNNPVEYLVQNSYNEINQLVNKKVGNDNASTPLQNVDYKYNIRGWMTDINDVDKNNSLFSFKIGYDKVSNSLNKYYNGNIAETIWKTNSNNDVKTYTYDYDGLNRLMNANFINITKNKSNIYSYDHTYDEKIKGYDHNGNILGIDRNGDKDDKLNPIDDLTYGYKANSNKLLSVTDALAEKKGFDDGNKTGDDYAYDANGNLTKDLNKGISLIKYNYLNLPTEVLWNASRKINYSYDASGVKLRKTVTDGSTITTTDYINGFQYVKKGDSKPVELQFFPTAEGYVNVTNGNKFNYVYNYTDHLGNVRLSYQKLFINNVKGCDKPIEISLDFITNCPSFIIVILEENNYYPFGLKHNGYTSNIIGNKNYNYKYNGKELQTDLDINFYDYGARNYNPAIGRWFNMDPLAEQYRKWSPYTYAVNNPIRFTDPDGMSVDDFVQRKDGSIYWDKNANSQASTKSGETYLGKNLSFTFNSYIDGKTYDGPLGSTVKGNKITTTIKLSATENSAGELTGLNATKATEIGRTFGVIKGRDYYPGEGGSNNHFTKSNSGLSINYEQHASVPKSEEAGLNAFGYKVVDVSQKLNINFDKTSGNLSVGAYTNVFPSATLKLNNTNTTMMDYKQPSFIKTHGVPYKVGQKQDFSYYPAKFYKRN
ncbi:DUF6443 domain-containing protein [Chishuiella sp.]|uniref:DUF6443 domain-containing protein n=1 Tax=Chishuiella sp. TaxID=1969467 RepID=UPI0028ABAB62|nr:DUF6443 domain-containing protein [Chishuiella sp.]